MVKTVVVYESMFGNTRAVAELIGQAMSANGPVEVVSVDVASAEVIATADLLIVGGPTHAHSMASNATRAAAQEQASAAGSSLDPSAEGTGLREWFKRGGLDGGGRSAAAFDTRMNKFELLTRRASKPIARRLRRSGFDVIGTHSFLVDGKNQLLPDEPDNVGKWVADLVSSMAADANPVHVHLGSKL